jgi:hypothetical protein
MEPIPLPKDIQDTLDRSKALRDLAKRPDKTYGPVTAEHFHSYEYLVSLLARRQDESNRLIEGLTKDIKFLTWVLVVFACLEFVKLLLNPS